MRLLSQYQIPLVTTIGSHDVQGRRHASYQEESDLGTLEEAGLVTVIHAGGGWEFGDIVVSGYGDGEPETNDLLDGLLSRPKKDLKFRIALVHASFGGTAEKMGRGQAIENCRIKGVDIALFGDIHDDPWHACQHRTGVVSYNPGAMIRKNQDERDRRPQFLDIQIGPPYIVGGVSEDEFRAAYKVNKNALVHINSERAWVFTVTAKDIPHLPAHIAFDVEAINQQIAERAQDFSAAIAASRKAKSESPEDLLRRVADESEFGEEVALLAISHLEEN